MPVDVTTPGSPGWYMKVLWTELVAKQPRLAMLERYRRGEPDVVLGRTARLQSAYARFQNMSRSNFAELIVKARTNRMSVRAIRTAAANDDNGDELAWQIWTANRLDVRQTALYRDLCTFDEAYMAGSAADVAGGEPVITVESPRQMITMQDPLRPWQSLAGLKVYYDPTTRTDYVVLWLSGKLTGTGYGEKWVAARTRKVSAPAVSSLSGGFDLLPFGASTADGSLMFDPEQPNGVLDPMDLADGYSGPTSEQYTLRDLPIVRISRDWESPAGVFEHHLNLLNAITHTTLQALVIVTMQAFKQRALKPSTDAEPLPEVDERTGKKIDYNEIFEADPGALWELPPGWDIWESGQADLNGIIAWSRKLVLDLAACTHTPFPMFSPDSANQSANGASLYREGLTFDVEELHRTAGAGIAQMFGVAFQLKGDAERGDPGGIIVDWDPADRYSILEMAQADAQSTLPLAQKAALFYGMSPAEVAITLGQEQQSAFTNALFSAPPAGTASTPPAGPVTTSASANS